MRTVKAVLMDMFGVIAHTQSTTSMDRLQALAGVPGPLFWERYWDLRPPYDRGEYTGSEYWQRVATALGVTFDQERRARLVAEDIASWSEVDEDCVALVGSLRQRGLRLGLLSNIPLELAEHYEASHAWLGYFDVLGFSCRVGWAKPDRRAYLWALDALGASAADTLFVDDRAENTHAAEACGIPSHQFTSVPELAAVLGP